VHGWCAAGAATWRAQLDSLADEFLVLAPDLPGFGNSPPRHRADAATFGDAVAEIVARTGRTDCVLIGWSMGGLVALEVARRGSEHLAGLGVVDVAPYGRPGADWVLGGELAANGFSARVDDWIARWPGEREEVVREVTTLAFVDPERHRDVIETLVEDALRADAATALAAFVNLLDCDFRASLPRIAVPVLFAFGGRSTSTTPSVRGYVARAVPDARVALFEECGHALMIEAPERFDAEVRAFARHLAGARA
jgi:pimeloyl-[acyl-carrier protein] methyl ester esterase